MFQNKIFTSISDFMRPNKNIPVRRQNSTRNYKRNLERMSNTSQSTRPVGRVLSEELLEGEGEKSEGETSIF